MSKARRDARWQCSNIALRIIGARDAGVLCPAKSLSWKCLWTLSWTSKSCVAACPVKLGSMPSACTVALERCAKKREAAAQAAREILNSIKPSARKLFVQRRLRLRRLVCKHAVRARTADRALSAAALYGAYTRPYLRCGSKADRLILKHSCVEHRISKNSCTDLWLFNVTWCGLLS